MKYIRTTHTVKAEIIDALERGKKILAIKTLRSNALGKEKLSLINAKKAVERLAYESGISSVHVPHAHPPEPEDDAPALLCGPKVKRFIVNYGKGDIEVDIEAMEMRALMDLEAIGLDACRDILDFVDALKSFSKGHKIGIIDKEPEPLGKEQ